jgi:hypothetical protein
MRTNVVDIHIAAGLTESQLVSFGGSQIFFERLSQSCLFSLDNDLTRHYARTNAKFKAGAFGAIRLYNRSAVLPVKGRLIIADDDVDFGDTQLPPSKLIGWTIDKNPGEFIDLPGIAAIGAHDAIGANYTAHGIPLGSQRERVQISSRNAIGGNVTVKNLTTGKQLYILPMPGVYTFPATEDLRIVFNTTTPLVSATDDMAVSEGFYA